MLVSGGGITLAYDPLLRLFQASNARWAYDGATMIAEYNLSNVLTRRFVHGPGVDEPLVWYEGTGTTDRRWLHADERGSIIAISDGTGAVTDTNRYNEYGMPMSPTAGRFQYTGQVWIASLGMYYYRARFYNPSIGRFMQTDPIGYGSGMNLYAYVLNDPVNLTDPMGLMAGFRDEFRAPVCIGSICANPGITVVGTPLPDRRGQVAEDLAQTDLNNYMANFGRRDSNTGERSAHEGSDMSRGRRREPREQCRRGVIVALYAANPVLGLFAAAETASALESGFLGARLGG